MQSVLVTVDALRADHLGQFGYHRDTMPALDRLLDDGRLYTQAFANGAHTQLSIPSILTGRYDGVAAAREGQTVATGLADAGVTTMGIHSNTVVSRDFPEIAGFQDFRDLSDVDEDAAASAETDDSTASLRDRLAGVAGSATNTVLRRLRPYLGDYEWAVSVRKALVPDTVVHRPTPYADAATVTDDVLEWVGDHADEPFFVWVHYMDPHRPYGFSLEDPTYTDQTLSYGKITELMAKAGVSPEDVTEPERDLIVDLYDSDLRYLSGELDRLFDGLEARGVWDEATVALTADHGEEFGEHGAYYHRNHPYDELIHVPLAIRGPDVPTGQVDEQRELIDVAPTMLAAHGVTPPAGMRGQPVTEGGERTVVSTALRSEFSACVRRDGWKYVVGDDGYEALFDLEADPDEQTSVLEAEPAAAARLGDAMPADIFDIPDSVAALDEPDDVSADAEERLADLGYLE